MVVVVAAASHVVVAAAAASHVVVVAVALVRSILDHSIRMDADRAADSARIIRMVAEVGGLPTTTGLK